MAFPMRAMCVGPILTLAVLVCCRGRDPSTATTSKQESGDVVASVNALHGDFIAALKRRHWSDPDPDAFETCVVEQGTIVREDPPSWNVLRVNLSGLKRNTYDSFWSKNERAWPTAPLDRGAMKLIVLTKAEDTQLKAILHDVDRTDYWDIFRTRYGNAVRVGLSAPGFSADRQHALIYYEASFGDLAAWGSYCLLKRVGERWEIVAEYEVWVS